MWPSRARTIVGAVRRVLRVYQQTVTPAAWACPGRDVTGRPDRRLAPDRRALFFLSAFIHFSFSLRRVLEGFLFDVSGEIRPVFVNLVSPLHRTDGEPRRTTRRLTSSGCNFLSFR